MRNGKFDDYYQTVSVYDIVLRSSPIEYEYVKL
jgi:hypothetical protein